MALFPSLSLSGSLGQILLSPQRSLGDIVWQIAGGLTMPLLNRESITQDYIISKENTKQAFYTMQSTINTALEEIQNAMKNIDITAKSMENTSQSYETNKNTFEIMQARFSQNLIDEISLLEYKNTYLRAKNNLLSAQLSYNQAAISLYKSFGGNFNPQNVFQNIKNPKIPKELKTNKPDTTKGI